MYIRFFREKTIFINQRKQRELEEQLKLQLQTETDEASMAGASDECVSRPMSPVQQLCIMKHVEVEEAKKIEEPTERDIAVSCKTWQFLVIQLMILLGFGIQKYATVYGFTYRVF